jgi:hypothetical protein
LSKCDSKKIKKLKIFEALLTRRLARPVLKLARPCQVCEQKKGHEPQKVGTARAKGGTAVPDLCTPYNIKFFFLLPHSQTTTLFHLSNFSLNLHNLQTFKPPYLPQFLTKSLHSFTNQPQTSPKTKTTNQKHLSSIQTHNSPKP